MGSHVSSLRRRPAFSSNPGAEPDLAGYSVKDFYPAAIGEILNGTYQVVAKLGYGTASTTWLCRDLRNHRYATLKIYASRQPQTNREVAALRHINAVLAASAPVKHGGATSIRTLIDQFEIPRSKTTSRANLCLVFEPLGMSLADARKRMFGGRMPVDIVKGVIFCLLQALDFLHREANMVHGDIQEDNILFAIPRKAELKKVEEAEMAEPSPRKVFKTHTIYSSRPLELQPTVPVLCDFGEARFGSESYGEHVMPDLYRAPEIVLRIEWDEKIDIWALGLMCGLKMWTLVEGTNLFTDNRGGRWVSALPHMARIVSLLGPPPIDLLKGWDASPVTRRYFDKTELTALEGEAKADFLRFLRRLLQWDPVKRPSAHELLEDAWFPLGLLPPPPLFVPG
ncbi:uncharacterized protein THITE_160781 [Thermothielavioides terrestris NRRL 8126]|uniref:Protein kinase domain-containing protein n=1 Tax=Thermothielavioides terrestris (strain ATCC 38088 / NRRL 8126) TaxID=578455 RepID=G2R645_THETT|nr:uncharacterized protein THITE_160781 [Thermothielavioides terrestris NRRL 8126]AEO67582.1 hypothetical protein THITE_160781 [Thermothielavioides terrestris NRRL 8126]